MTSQHDKPKQWRPWQLILIPVATVVMTVTICGLFLSPLFLNVLPADPSRMYDGAVEAYRSGSYSDAISKCDHYLDRRPNGSEADKVRELRGQARFALANKSFE
jgi:TolA-binding protein